MRRILKLLAGCPAGDCHANAQELEDADAPAGECIGFAAAMCCLRGAAFEALDNGARAASCFSAALRADPFCYEAFQVGT